MHVRRLLTCDTLCSLRPARSASAAQYFVSTTGSDTTAGTTSCALANAAARGQRRRARRPRHRPRRQLHRLLPRHQRHGRRADRVLRRAGRAHQPAERHARPTASTSKAHRTSSSTASRVTGMPRAGVRSVGFADELRHVRHHPQRDGHQQRHTGASSPATSTTC